MDKRPARDAFGEVPRRNTLAEMDAEWRGRTREIRAPDWQAWLNDIGALIIARLAEAGYRIVKEKSDER